ncbi:hypothetical protein DPMN_121753 [Dreissena polymorpha]|uniref:Uncharacterized protein n=1 Tax=Dreissena polymorpha TaxID=45954 RepID=A0A9D4JRC2_DREPO|nr:hypothetical protein DPMN_121753 [Dreissena polymorpha]
MAPGGWLGEFGKGHASQPPAVGDDKGNWHSVEAHASKLMLLVGIIELGGVWENMHLNLLLMVVIRV